MSSALLDGKYSTTVFRICKCKSFGVASCMSHIVMHAGMSVASSMAFILNCRPVIS